MPPPDLTRRELLGAATGAGMAAYAATQGAAAVQDAVTKEGTTMSSLQTQATPTAGGPPNILYFQVDNLGYGELGCYGGGIPRGAPTARDAAPAYGSPHIINLLADPKEREPMDYPYLHSWVGLHFGKIMGAFQESIAREPPIPPGAPLDFVPAR